MKQKAVALALSTIMLLGGATNAFANTSNIQVASEELAIAIAYDFLTAREENENAPEKLPDNYNLVLSKTMYETEGVPSAYKFDIMNKDGNYNGYIVIGAQEEYAPVIEYSFSDEKGFLDSVSANEEIYYMGGIDYFAVNEETGEVKDLITHEEVEMASVATYGGTAKSSAFSDMWDTIYEDYEKSQTVNSRFIPDPSPLEDGYKSLNIRNIIDSTWAPYKLMNDFTGDVGDCGPVAATNMMIMAYHSFGENVFGSQYDLSDSDEYEEAVMNTYNELFDATKCDPVNGTYPHDLYQGIDSYLSDVSSRYEDATSRYQWVEYLGVDGMMDNVKNQVCQIIQLDSNSIYGAHYVYAFGYEEYVHTDHTNVYFMIADGWYSGVRYIQYDVAKMLTVVPVEF